ncbi:MAG TPA: hypothetical protein VIE16_07335 [Phenylobacterium sp.]|jgi:cytochrome c5
MGWQGAVAGGAVVVAVLGSVAWAAQPPTSQAPAVQPPPEAQPQPSRPDPKDILEGVCSGCHGVDFIAEHRKSHDDWDFTVHRMMDKGAELSPDEADALVDYLAKTYPAEAKPAGPAPN